MSQRIDTSDNCFAFARGRFRAQTKCLLSLIVIASAGVARAQSPTLEPCTVAGTDARCGDFWVYENRDTRAGRKIPLKVIVFPARFPNPLPDPMLFVSPGGPGTTNSVQAIGAAANMPERDHRDVILVDLRGTSGPSRLDCPETGLGTTSTVESLFNLDRIRACRSMLSRSVDLTQYTTPRIVDDLDELRRVLGIERVNLFGQSWGTRAAIVLAQRHPTAVRSMVLEGVVPLSYRYPLPGVAAARRTLSLVQDQCGGDSVCHRAFPRLRADVDSLLAAVRRRPLRARIRSGGRADSLDVEIPDAAFLTGMRAALYSAPEQRRLPWMIHEAIAGNTVPLVNDLWALLSRRRRIVRLGFLLSVSCSDDVWRIRPEETTDTLGFGDMGSVRGIVAACAEWPTRPLPAEDVASRRLDVPALIVSGSEDPATPPGWGDSAQVHLPKSQHVIAPGGHVPAGTCIDSIEASFVSHPLSRVDTTCVATMRRPPFDIGRAELPRPARSGRVSSGIHDA